MPRKGYKQSSEHKEKVRVSLLGNSRRKWIPHTKDTKRKLSEFQKNHSNSGRFKKGQVAWNKGIKLSEEWRKKLSESCMGRTSAFKGKRHTKESKVKNSLAHTNRPNMKIRGPGNWMFGRRGKLSPNYIDGSSTKPHGPGFTKRLKNRIRKRDNKECQICFKHQEDYFKRTGMQFPIHHIDYDKNNHNEDNLVTVCPVCHAKTNIREERIYWRLYFSILLSNK